MMIGQYVLKFHHHRISNSAQPSSSRPINRCLWKPVKYNTSLFPCTGHSSSLSSSYPSLSCIRHWHWTMNGNCSSRIASTDNELGIRIDYFYEFTCNSFQTRWRLRPNGPSQIRPWALWLDLVLILRQAIRLHSNCDSIHVVLIPSTQYYPGLTSTNSQTTQYHPVLPSTNAQYAQLWALNADIMQDTR